LDEKNTIDFSEYKFFYENNTYKTPNTASLIGELHYVFNVPNPIIYPDCDALLSSVSGNVGVCRTAAEQDVVEKNSVLDQLITAEFKKVTLMVIIMLSVLCLLGIGLLLAMRFEIFDVPLHAVCVNLVSPK
jgi:hypothetical protein